MVWEFFFLMIGVSPIIFNPFGSSVHHTRILGVCCNVVFENLQKFKFSQVICIQSTGPSRCHTALFKKIRSARIDSFVAETNKLLIRLDKLLKDLPNDPVKRKGEFDYQIGFITFILFLEKNTLVRNSKELDDRFLEQNRYYTIEQYADISTNS